MTGLGHFVMREDTEDPQVEVMRRLDFLQQRFDGFDRLRRNGATIDEKIIDDMERNYTIGLEHLRSMKCYNELRTYSAWYKRYLNVGDPL